ncbi:oxygenase [Streptomyces triticagri]|uniref:Oxygenase n=1 Tax=Streptomyces triticagri TaxID=2293568 RepID=A0A372M4I6_9ACTN|nr:TauD/TfdA family dioxygenase [Streptomyces triticagri]RFU85217.1 oxygenase [Streptomyces triticagri]
MPDIPVHRLPEPASAAFRAAVLERVADGAVGDSVLGRPDWSLPEPLAEQLRDALGGPSPRRGFRVVRGLFDGLPDLGPTPDHWSRVDRERSATHDVALALAAGLLGDVFGWADQQAGRLVHNILPSPGYESMQVGASSTVPLAWHTEDGFHPERADLLLLACIRNPDGIGTRLAGIRDVSLPEAALEQLRRPLLVIEPDDSYEDEDAAGQESVGMATVWDGPDGLCIRYDPSYARRLTDDEDFRRAYDGLAGAFEESGFIVPLEPGDLLMVDNDAMVHGRVAFRPRYDGTDRWLKRVLVRAPRQRPEHERLEHGFQQERVAVRDGAPDRALLTAAR